MLRLSIAAHSALLAHASSEPDREVCGLVWQSEAGQVAYPLPNIHPEPTKYYRTAPRDVRAAFDAMDKAGGTPVAWYHSHPSGKPDPSEADMQGAMDIQMYYLIVYPHTWQVISGQPTEWQLSAWECLEPCILVQAEWVME